MKSRVALLEASLQQKEEEIQACKEALASSEARNKKWMGKLDEEIETNSEARAKLQVEIN